MYWNKGQRRGVLIIMGAILGVWGGVLLERRYLSDHSQPRTLQDILLDSSVNEVDSFLFANVKENTYTYAQPEQNVETFPFDPNTADSTQLLRLGFAPYQVRNIYKYRAKGGRFHRPEDVKKIYGMTPEVWKRLAPYVRIGEDYRYYTDEMIAEGNDVQEIAPRDSVSSSEANTRTYPSTEKFQDIQQLDINTIDSTTLKRIPQIASYRAKQILRYRERLGGFYSLSQLAEIENLPYGIEEWFTIQTGVYRKLNINTATYKELVRHPYIAPLRAQAILYYRKNYGTIHSLDELSLLDGFSETERQRLQPYITF